MILALLVAIPATCKNVDDGQVDVLVIIAYHWGANTFLQMDNFASMGWHVTTAGVTQDVTPCDWFKRKTGVAPFHVDHLVSEITDITQYDVLALMSATSFYGPESYLDILGSPEAMALIRDAVDNGLAVWATCAGVRVLAAADVLQGRQVTGALRYQAEYEAAGATYLGADHAPVIDGSIITTVRGNYYHPQITQAITTVLQNQNAAHGSFSTRDIETATTELAWPEVIWARESALAAPSGGRGICRCADGGYAVAGFTWKNGTPDALLMKLDNTGHHLWTKTYGGPGWEFGNSICATPDGGFAIAGTATSQSAAGDQDISIIRTDADGKLLWQKTFGAAGLESAQSICATNDGGFAVCGHTETEGNGEDDALLFKIDGNGDQIWSKTFGGDRADLGTDVCETAGGNLIMSCACGSEPYTAKNLDYCLVNTSADGEVLWWKSFGNDSGEGFDYPYSVLAASDGGYLLTGACDSTVPMDFMHIKTGDGGDAEWTLINEGVFYEFSMDALELNDGYIFAGNTEAQDIWNNQVWMIRTDLDGNILWEKQTGGDTHDWITAMCLGEDGSVVVTGHTFSEDTNTWEIFVSRIDSGASSTPYVQIEMPSDHFNTGDTFYLNTQIWNPGVSPEEAAALFVFLDVYGSYFFWPGWSDTPDFEYINLREGAQNLSILPAFDWPADTGTVDGIGIFAAMTNHSLTELYGSYDYVEFGWSE